jgi:hypothetical protein
LTRGDSGVPNVRGPHFGPQKACGFAKSLIQLDRGSL